VNDVGVLEPTYDGLDGLGDSTGGGFALGVGLCILGYLGYRWAEKAGYI